MTSSDRRSFRVQSLHWLAWKVIVPVVLIAFFWPAFAAFTNLPHPFSAAMSPGELLLFSAVILIEAFGQGRSYNINEFWLEIIRYIALIVGVILVGALVLIKVDAVNQTDPHRLILYSCFSCSVAIFSVVVSFLAFAVATKREENEMLSAMAPGATTS